MESVSEILADKVTALTFRPYVKGRDIWDVYHLTKERGLKVNWSMVEQKAADYGYTTANLRALTPTMTEKLIRDGPAALAREMPRFLSPATLEQYAENFPAMAQTVARNIQQPEHQRKRERGELEL